jgi:hypothetical protein
MRNGKRLGIGLAAACAALLAAAAQAQDGQLGGSYFEEAKITVNERARADGYMRVRVRPENGESREATIAVPKRMSENDIARSLADALEVALDDDYKVDKDAGEHVKIRKAKRDVANFAVEISFSAPGFTVILDN